MARMVGAATVATEQAAQGMNSIDGMDRGSRWLTPTRQFYVALISACLVGTLVISLAVAVLVRELLFAETRDVTVATVNAHFRFVFGDDIFSRSFTSEELQRFDRLVRGHFDTYDIVQVKFYRPDGRITYSYRPDLVEGQSPEGPMHDELRRALGGVVIMSHESLSEADTDRGRSFADVFEIYVPVWTDGRVVGVAEVYRNTEQLMSSIRRIQIFVTMTVILFSSVLFFSLRQIYLGSTQRIISQSRALRRTLREIESIHNQTLESLSVVLDARDSNTEGHSRRVSEYTMAIAEQMGLSGVKLEDVGRGALLHDVGKMGVPDAILFKPGPLSAEEWVEMRKHPDFGYRMMAHIEFLRGSLPIIRHHHERYDGTGYPLGLGGDQIPLGARIFAVADTLDAITSNRPYRKAGTFAAASEEISRHNGTQFDPRVVAAYAAIPTRVWIRISEGVAAERGSAWGILQSAASAS